MMAHPIMRLDTCLVFSLIAFIPVKYQTLCLFYGIDGLKSRTFNSLNSFLKMIYYCYINA